ncbi:MAG: hypothetical protein ACPGVU_16510 [Limisphaerales bacterium]
MNWLSKQERTVLFMVLFLLFVGLAVKTYRQATLPTEARPLPQQDN